jgi:hypothetical protein
VSVSFGSASLGAQPSGPSFEIVLFTFKVALTPVAVCHSLRATPNCNDSFGFMAGETVSVGQVGALTTWLVRAFSACLTASPGRWCSG